MILQALIDLIGPLPLGFEALGWVGAFLATFFLISTVVRVTASLMGLFSRR